MPQTQRPLRIVHLLTDARAGGISRYVLDLAVAMRARGHESIIAGQSEQWHARFVEAGLSWVEVPIGGGYRQLRRSAEVLRGQFADASIDVVHAHYRRAALVGRRLAKASGAPMLFTLHLPDIPMRGIWRWLSDFGDHCHAPSTRARQWLLDVAHVSPPRITTIPHGVDPTRFNLSDNDQRMLARNRLKLPADRAIAGFVGRFASQKNPFWALDLAAALKAEDRPELVVMMGSGPDEAKMQQRIEAEALRSHVRLLPFGDPVPLYQACDLLVLPSQAEGFALACTEAMSIGRPVLRTRTAGVDEQIIEGVTGESVAVDHDAFIERAMAMLEDCGRLTEMGAAAADHVRRHLRFETQVDRTIALYEYLSGRREILADDFGWGAVAERQPVAGEMEENESTDPSNDDATSADP